MAAFGEIARTGCASIGRHPIRSAVTIAAVLSVLVPYLVGLGVVEGIRLEVGEFYDYLTNRLTNEDLAEFAEVERGRWAQLSLLRRFPAIGAWLRLKTALSLDLLRFWREAISDAGGKEKILSANAFMPPLTLCTGLDIAGTLEIAQAVSPKLYTMHWSAMVEFWGQALMAKNDVLGTLLKK